MKIFTCNGQKNYLQQSPCLTCVYIQVTNLEYLGGDAYTLIVFDPENKKPNRSFLVHLQRATVVDRGVYK